MAGMKIPGVNLECVDDYGNHTDIRMNSYFQNPLHERLAEQALQRGFILTLSRRISGESKLYSSQRQSN